ncbi:hypothetical protein C1645_850564 [Glomus cerebriforme]|uniref:Uncharacterized protein n=1 Tax=Glomus cerebriforme TaxID=658196 RepID=A0A397TSH7_9GLOM|nr:hypothetical protein C1645_850564 [Glomus cerebriforme]
MEMLNKRSNQEIQKKCMRCNIEDENWIHIWKCEANKITLYDIVNNNIEKLINKLKQQGIRINEEIWTKRIVELLLERSTIKENQLIIHECIKGIYNKKLTNIDNNKQIRREIKEFIEDIAMDTKKNIWNEQCNEITRQEKYIENKKLDRNRQLKKYKKQINGILVGDKKDNREEMKDKILQLAKNNVNRKNKNIMKSLITDRYIGQLIENRKKVYKIWTTNYIFDLEYNTK